MGGHDHQPSVSRPTEVLCADFCKRAIISETPLDPQGYCIPSLIVTKWLEPLSEEWEDTIINSLSVDQQKFTVRTAVRNLTARKLRSIRKATGGGEAGIELAEQTVEYDLTIQPSQRRYVPSGILGFYTTSSLISTVKSIKSTAMD